MANETVDVIIPSYNRMPLIKKAIESVLAQSHKDFLLYVVDDGSQDKVATEKYIKSLDDPRVSFIKRPHLGRSVTRNYGIQNSTSAYVAMIDSDDIWHKDKLEKQIALLEQQPEVGMVYGLANIINDSGQITGALKYQKRGIIFNFLLSGNKVSGGASMVMVRREVFKKVGLFNEQLSMAEDWELWLRIAREFKVDFVPEYLADIRIDEISERPKFIEKAKGLEATLNVMLAEFSLNYFQTARLTTACLRQSCALYLDAGDRQNARRVLLRMLSKNPLALLSGGKYYSFVYIRIIVGNSLLRSIRQRRSDSLKGRSKNG